MNSWYPLLALLLASLACAYFRTGLRTWTIAAFAAVVAVVFALISAMGLTKYAKAPAPLGEAGDKYRLEVPSGLLRI